MFWMNVEQVHQLKVPFCEWHKGCEANERSESGFWDVSILSVLWYGVCEEWKTLECQVL